MALRFIPATTFIAAIGAATTGLLVALIAGLSVTTATVLSAGIVAGLTIVATLDYWRTRIAWNDSAPKLIRRLPAALALGVTKPIQIFIDTPGTESFRVRLYDHTDPSLSTVGLPIDLTLPAGRRVEVAYTVTPTRRGEVHFSPADVRIRSRLGFWELLERVGADETRRVYPDFAQVARYAWLAGDRRLSEIGIKTYQQRGEGTDFKQLSEYRVGDSVRHIDWKASLRFEKPIIREFQDERDQCVLLLIDCGRRMRADDRQSAIGSAHFDQVLNAVMLLSYVALKQGDAVGAMTFGTPAGAEKSFAPRKGAIALNALMGELYAVQPTPTHSDYVGAARDLLRRQQRRALVIMVTNFRDEDGGELSHALRLLRSRHLVLLASLRERIVGEMISQPMVGENAAVEISGAHLYEQSRRDAFNKLAARDSLMVDAEPQRLGIELVNRYHAVKRAGLI